MFDYKMASSIKLIKIINTKMTKWIDEFDSDCYLIFSGKDSGIGLPIEWAVIGRSAWVGSCLTRKYWTGLPRKTYWE
jgi:hypothetical protein